MTWRLGPTGMEAHAQEGLLPFGGIRKGFDSICPEHWSLRRFQICGWSGLGEWEGKDVLAERTVLYVGNWIERDRVMLSLTLKQTLNPLVSRNILTHYLKFKNLPPRNNSKL